MSYKGTRVVLLLAGLSLSTSSVRSGPRYDIIDLGMPPGGLASEAHAINNKGEVVGQYIDTSGNSYYHAFIWKDGVMTELPGYSASNSWAEDINDGGLIVGRSFEVGGVYYAVLWNNGVPGSIGDLGSNLAWAVAINNAGDITGQSFYTAADLTNSASAFLKPAGGAMQGIGPVGRIFLEVRDINNLGHVTGAIINRDATNGFRAFIYDGDSVVNLGLPAEALYSGASAINDSDHVAGSALFQYSSGTANRAMLYKNGNWIDFYGGAPSSCIAINNRGDIVGTQSFNPSQAVLWKGNQVYSLISLIDPDSGWSTLTVPYDINDSGQIVGVGIHNGVTRAFLMSPVKSIKIVRPELDQLFIAGEKDTIRWTSQQVDSVKISVILHYYDFADRTEFPIVQSFPADNGLYVWDIPDSLLSRQCRIVIQAVDDSSIVDTGADFKIKEYELTRITDDGEYEAFSPAVHGWSFENSSFVMWPSSWWGQFSYLSGIDPNTNAVYPSFFTNELHAHPWDFIDWPLFVRTFGMDTCYTTDAPTGQPSDYWPSATAFWASKTDDHSGSCVGLAATSIVAFGNKEILLQHFPDFGSFNDLYTLPINNSRREIINQLMFTQWAKLPQLNEDTVLRNPNATWIQKMQDMFLDEDRSHDAFLAMYNSRGGGHAVTPYKLVKDSVSGIPGDLYLLYIYDNNYPGDSTRAIVIRPSDGFWRYPATGPIPWLNYGSGLFLEPFSLYLQDAEFPSTPTDGNTVTTVAQGSHEDYERIFGFADAAVIIRGGSDSIGLVDTTIFNTINGADPITAKTGFLSRPIGYEFPEQEVEVLVSQITDSIASFFVEKPSIIYSINRTDVTPADSDHFLVKSGVNLWNTDSSNKSLNLQGIVIEPGSEKVYSVRHFDLSASDSAYFDVSSNAFLYLVNVGADEVYDLTLRVVSATGGTEVQVANIQLEGNAGHLIWPDWSDLTAPIRIEIDKNNDGPVDDTIYVNAQPTNITDPPEGDLPTGFKLQQNYPNPFNPVTLIEYTVPSRSQVKIDIFNVLGQKVRGLVNETKAAGKYSTEWKGVDDAGDPVSTGVYLYRFQAGDFVQTKKMLLLK